MSPANGMPRRRGPGVGAGPPGTSTRRFSVQPGPPTAPKWVFGLAYRVLTALVGVVTGGLVVTAIGAVQGWQWNRTLLIIYGALTTLTIFVGEALYSAAYARRVRRSRLREAREAIELLIQSSYVPEQLWPHVVPMSGAQLRVRRVMDVVVAVAGLIALAPMLVLVTALIKLDSPGNAVVSKRRLGYQGRPIRLLVFRTSVDVPDEQRLTRVGRWLVRTALDQLPQLMNVLRGDLSLVGPAPGVSERQDAVLNLPLFLARPGMTGPWAVSPHPMSPEEYLHVHLAYVQNWSLRRDLGILLQTVAAALRSPPLFTHDRPYKGGR